MQVLDSRQLKPAASAYTTYSPDGAHMAAHRAGGGAGGDQNACIHCGPQAVQPPLWEQHIVPENEVIYDSSTWRRSGKDTNVDVDNDLGPDVPFIDKVHNGCVSDIILTGETDPEHAAAWGHRQFHRRVRDADGSIVLRSVPVSISFPVFRWTVCRHPE